MSEFTAKADDNAFHGSVVFRIIEDEGKLNAGILLAPADSSSEQALRAFGDGTGAFALIVTSIATGIDRAFVRVKLDGSIEFATGGPLGAVVHMALDQTGMLAIGPPIGQQLPAIDPTAIVQVNGGISAEGNISTRGDLQTRLGGIQIIDQWGNVQFSVFPDSQDRAAAYMEMVAKFPSDGAPEIRLAGAGSDVPFVVRSKGQGGFVVLRGLGSGKLLEIEGSYLDTGWIAMQTAPTGGPTIIENRGDAVGMWIEAKGIVDFRNPIKAPAIATTAKTFAEVQALVANEPGSRFYITDATMIFNSSSVGQIVSGGGATSAPIYFDGSNYRYG